MAGEAFRGKHEARAPAFWQGADCARHRLPNRQTLSPSSRSESAMHSLYRHGERVARHNAAVSLSRNRFRKELIARAIHHISASVLSPIYRRQLSPRFPYNLSRRKRAVSSATKQAPSLAPQPEARPFSRWPTTAPYFSRDMCELDAKVRSIAARPMRALLPASRAASRVMSALSPLLIEFWNKLCRKAAPQRLSIASTRFPVRRPTLRSALTTLQASGRNSYFLLPQSLPGGPFPP